MRELQDVAVARAALQLVAPRSGELRFSEAELPLDAGVAEFLTEHVDRGLHDPQARAADFVVHGPDRASDLCARLLDDPDQIVEVSKGLAELLYKVMEDDERTSGGTLAVLVCDATGADGNPTQLIALLKLDPATGYRAVATTDADGRPVLRLEVEPDILPSARERVHKCAFIGQGGPDAPYHMLLIDRQRGRDVVSRYWVSDFLGAELVVDAPEATKQLYRALKAGYNEVAPDLNAEQLIELDQAITGAVSGLSVNVDKVVSELPVDEATRERIDEIVTRRLPQREFDLDVQTGNKLVRRRHFEGDHGLRLSIDADHLDEVITVEDIPSPGVGGPRRRIIIETSTWRER